jgi:oligoendopeptidase F
MAFDYSKLPHEFKRRYLPAVLAFDWPSLSRIFEELSSRQVGSATELERWLSDEAEFDSFVYEQRTVRYVNNSRQTDDREFRKAFEEYTEELEPRIKVAKFGLLKKYTSSPFRVSLPRETYSMEDRRRQNAVAIFRPENVDLERQEAALSQNYQRITSAMTVNFRGEERTLQQMSKFYEEPDRTIRKEAWTLADARALADHESLDMVYDQMVQLRDRIALNAGFKDYREYIFVRKDRFDYTPADCLRFHRAVEEHLVPLSREIDKQRKGDLGVETLYPWDLRVDPKGRPPLSPFEDGTGLVGRASKVLAKVDPQFSGYFARMVDLQLLDLESRKGKAPGGYQEEFTEAKFPFIFMNAARRDSDVRTLLHECGHSFHTFLMRDKELPYFNANANLPLEFAEVASITMEIISGEHYEGAFYDSAEAKRSNLEEAISNVKLFTWVATVDAFQHWVYTHPGHSHEERAKAWVETFGRFGGAESFDGLETSRAFRWQRQLHIFEVPFYYIEYGIALTGALGIWGRYRKDRAGAIEAYKRALSLGSSRSLPELFEAADLRWDIGPQALKGFADELRSAIGEYGE